MELSKEDFLKMASSKYDELSEQLDSQTIDFYEYESRLESIMLDFSRTILSSSLSNTEVSAHKKKMSKQDLVK